ncbi:MAG TPA: hypothetical protein VFB28_03040 [Terriglobales bacterium]|jgi:uncharacterized protein (UPF0335 family)|nr:hypothetical protein [Terriglobales bacterium]
MKQAILLFAIVIAAVSLGAGQNAPPANSSGTSVEEWQKQFDEVCSKTQDAMTISIEELKSLIQKCDALEPQIQKLEETRKKVYQRRLGQCRGLYAYVLESKEKDKK